MPYSSKRGQVRPATRMRSLCQVFFRKRGCVRYFYYNSKAVLWAAARKRCRALSTDVSDFFMRNFFVARFSPLTYAKAKHRCDAKQNTYPLLCAQAFLENEERRKRCQNKSSSVDNREEYDAVDHARQIQIELVVHRKAHTADKHQKD